MEKIEIKKVLNKVIVFLLTITFGMAYSSTPQTPPPGLFDEAPGDGGAGATGPGGPPTTPIDMYEGILVGVAVILIVGYYFYSRNKRVANS